MADEYPRGAYLLLLIGGILEIIVGITVVLAAAVYLMVASYSAPGRIMALGQGMDMLPMMWGAACIVIYILWFIIWGSLMIVAARWIKTGNADNVHKGAILGLIASILGMNIISLIGAILAFTWKPPQTAEYVPPPPPPS